jgi:hypothetical protein
VCAANLSKVGPTPVALKIGDLPRCQEQVNDLAARAPRSVIPAGQVEHVHDADVRTGTPTDPAVGFLPQGVPGQAESALHEL